MEPTSNSTSPNRTRSPQRSPDSRTPSGSNEFKFEVLSEGLGFHPFSDGLPYAPVSKVNTSNSSAPAPTHARPAPIDRSSARDMGTGAIAAGPPRFAIPAAPAALSQNPRTSRQPLGAGTIASTPIATVAASVAAAVSTPATATATATAHAAATAVPASTALIVEDHPGFFILIKRLLAWTLDVAFTSAVLMGSVSLAFGRTFPFNVEWMLRPEPFLMSILWFTSTHWMLQTFQEVAFRTSFGKALFGLRVTGSAIERFLRAFFFVPSVSFLGLGLAWGLFNRQRRCWHDVAANAWVIEVTRL